jgi:hypothetical protein
MYATAPRRANRYLNPNLRSSSQWTAIRSLTFPQPGCGNSHPSPHEGPSFAVELIGF